MSPKSTRLILLVLFGLSSGQASGNEFETVKALLKQNKADEAYQYLTAKDAFHMGEPDYDLLLARTALKSGRPNEAIFAYERVLMTQPKNHPAKVELAIAYFQIDQLENSKRLFKEALIARPPANLQEDIHRYLEHIEEKLTARRHAFGAELSLKQGWDSNINSATNESEIQLTVGTYRPSEGVDKETSDSFTELLTRANYNYNFNVNASLFSSIGYSNRENNHKQFDSQRADARFGYSHLTGLGRISLPLSYQTMWLDNKQLREVTTASINLNRADKAGFTDYNLQYGEIRYPDQSALDVDFVAASFAFGLSSANGAFNQQYALFYGDETATNSTYDFNAREYHGFQARFPVRVGQKHVLTPKAVYQKGVYRQRHPFFKEKRQDKFIHYEFDWRWYLSRHWQLNSQISRTDTASTVAIYTYQRNVIFVGITYVY